VNCASAEISQSASADADANAELADEFHTVAYNVFVERPYDRNFGSPQLT